MDASKSKIRESVAEFLKSLRSAFSAAYNLAPIAVGCLTIVVMGVVMLALWWTPLMEAVVLLIVFGVAVIVYLSTNNYGEAALALAAGLLSVYSVEWKASSFVSFVIVWVGFSFLALLIASIRLAASTEDIYIQATNF